jgi:hypothetical protein
MICQGCVVLGAWAIGADLAANRALKNMRPDDGRRMDTAKAKSWLCYCDSSKKGEILNAAFSLGSSSQSHDRGNGGLSPFQRHQRAQKQQSSRQFAGH